MEYKRTPKRVLEWKPICMRIRGRPRKRWIEGIEEDMQITGIRRWRKRCKERAEWKKITEKKNTKGNFTNNMEHIIIQMLCNCMAVYVANECKRCVFPPPPPPLPKKPE
jgi:hypothetical protein